MREHLFKSQAALVDATTEFLSDRLSEALNQRGRASLMLSGGSSPKPIYEALAQQDIAWDGVGIGLVDERWVPRGAEGSNADFVETCLKDTPAERAHFVPLFNDNPDAATGVEATQQALATLAQPFDLCIMGLGLDGHTASWFPRSHGLEAALDEASMSTVVAIDATGSPVAGDHTDRITLTYSAVAASRDVVLLLSSAEKLAVFRQSAQADVLDAPVKALLSLGDRLSVFAIYPENGV